VVAVTLLGISIALVILATARNAPSWLLVATVALVVGTGAFCVWTGAAVFYQARSEPRPLGGRSVVWSPPLVMRVALLVIAVSLGIIAAAVATAGPRRACFSPSGWPFSPWRSSPQGSSCCDSRRTRGESRVPDP
jgi:hypothetical protein